MPYYKPKYSTRLNNNNYNAPLKCSFGCSGCCGSSLQGKRAVVPFIQPGGLNTGMVAILSFHFGNRSPGLFFSFHVCLQKPLRFVRAVSLKTTATLTVILVVAYSLISQRYIEYHSHKMSERCAAGAPTTVLGNTVSHFGGCK